MIDFLLMESYHKKLLKTTKSILEQKFRCGHGQVLVGKLKSVIQHPTEPRSGSLVTWFDL